MIRKYKAIRRFAPPLVETLAMRPAMFNAILSSYHLWPASGSRQRIWLANAWPNLSSITAPSHG